MKVTVYIRKVQFPIDPALESKKAGNLIFIK